MSDSTTSITYKYRLRPTKAQIEALDFLFWKGRELYNLAVQIQRAAFACDYEYISRYTMRDFVCEWAKERGYLDYLPANTVDCLTERLELSYRQYFDKVKRWKQNPDPLRRPSPPRERSRFGKNAFPSLPYRRDGYKFIPESVETKRAILKLRHAGSIRVIYHRPLPEGAKIKRCIVMRDKCERWWVVLQLDIPAVEVPAHGGGAVGIDMGVAYLLALSDGSVYDNPRWYKEAAKKRRVIHRKLDRQRRANNPQNFNPDGTVKPGVFIWHKSNRQRDTENELRKLEDHIAQQRWYFWHTVTDYLTRTYSLIALEDIDFEFMRKNRRLAMPAADASFSMFRQMLEYKAQRTGTRLVYVPAAYTSQTCSDCGCIDSENRRTQAAFKCVACGHEENADINAAKNILQRGLLALETELGKSA